MSRSALPDWLRAARRGARSGRRSNTADILLAACLWGTTGTIRTYVPEASNVSIAAVRIVLGGLILLAVAAGTARGAGLRRLVSARRNWPLLVLGAAAIAVYQTAFFSAAARTGVAVGTVVTLGSGPVFTGLLGLITRQAAFTRRWGLATAGAVAGCAALVGGGQDAGADPVGIGLALLSGFSYAVYATITSTFISRGEEDRAVVGALFGMAAVVLLPVLLAGSPGWTLHGTGMLIALYLGAVTTTGGYLLFARGLRTTPATTATTLTLAEPAVAAVLGLAVLGEHLGGVALCGLALLAGSLVVLMAPSRR
ncbi:EamA family transporter [Actinomadura barringtoniae]|uniref:EamA family transporter n=1 Tax=Actinomadura barringtoniae TaxID=1427535 RepID=A0A939T4F9_9ACTN|nr:EamA family transporter [Actinomadura barringtoniae]MBO2452511.1 EamA family transporter [Actinomadura barringtoniae]